MSNNSSGAVGIPYRARGAKVNSLGNQPILDPIGSLIVANSIVTKIREMNGSECAAIAGGYARDMAFNRAPRDIDIMATAGHYSEWNIKQLHEIEEFLKSFGRVESYMNYNGGEDQNRSITCCFKLPELCIDIVLYNSSFVNFRDVMNGFDANINQYYISDIGLPVYHGAYHGKLRFIDYPNFSLSSSRINKTIDIAKEVGW